MLAVDTATSAFLRADKLPFIMMELLEFRWGAADGLFVRSLPDTPDGAAGGRVVCRHCPSFALHPPSTHTHTACGVLTSVVGPPRTYQAAQLVARTHWTVCSCRHTLPPLPHSRAQGEL